MSNIITITPTRFVNVRSGNVSYGYRMYDAYDAIYNNTWDDIPDDDMEVLERICESAKEAVRVGCKSQEYEMLSHILEMEYGLNVDEEYYSFDEIKGVLKQYIG